MPSGRHRQSDQRRWERRQDRPPSPEPSVLIPTTPSEDHATVLGNFLGNNSRHALPNDAFLAWQRVVKQHLKPFAANRSADAGHVSRTVERLEREGSTRSGWRLLSSTNATVRGVLCHPVAELTRCRNVQAARDAFRQDRLATDRHRQVAPPWSQCPSCRRGLAGDRGTIGRGFSAQPTTLPFC